MDDRTILLLYFLLHGNSLFLSYVLARTDIDNLVGGTFLSDFPDIPNTATLIQRNRREASAKLYGTNFAAYSQPRCFLQQKPSAVGIVIN